MLRAARHGTLGVQERQPRRFVRGDWDHGAETREIEHFAHTWIRAYENETATERVRDRRIRAHDKGDTGRVRIRHVVKVRHHLSAPAAFQLVRFLAQILRVRTGNETSPGADDADVVFVIKFDEHPRHPVLWYRTTWHDRPEAHPNRGR